MKKRSVRRKLTVDATQALAYLEHGRETTGEKVVRRIMENPWEFDGQQGQPA